jgi:hypothetical protein
MWITSHSSWGQNFFLVKDEQGNTTHAFAHNTNVSSAELKELSKIDTLVSLTLGMAPEGVDLEKGAMQELANFQSLESLRLAKSQLTDEDLANLPKLAALKNLTIEGYIGNEHTVLTDKAIAVFSRIKHLDCLTIRAETKFSDDFVKTISAHPTLTTLQIQSDHFTDRALESISSNSRLKKLNISSPHFTDKGFQRMSTMQSLKEIEIESPLLTKQSLLSLKPLTGLKVIDLPMKDMDRNALAVAAGMKSLERLILRRAEIVDEGFIVLEGHPSIKSLFLENAILTKKSEVILHSMKALEYAQFAGESWIHVYQKK